MWHVANIPEGYTRTGFPALYEKAGIRVVTVDADGSVRRFYVPNWAVDVLSAFSGKTLKESAVIGKRLLVAMNALDEESRSAAMTVLILGGIEALTSHVLGSQL